MTSRFKQAYGNTNFWAQRFHWVNGHFFPALVAENLMVPFGQMASELALKRTPGAKKGAGGKRKRGTK